MTQEHGKPASKAGQRGFASVTAGPFLWPLAAAAAASEASASFFSRCAQLLVDAGARPHLPEPPWTTANRIALELQTMRLRDFSTGARGLPALICAPFALHGATVADFAPGHSLVRTLRDGGVGRIFVTDWRTASHDMRLLAIDNYLADLNVAIDEIGQPVNLIGLCQGGWLALVYAARFPAKVRRLVLAGAPVDIGAGRSNLSRTADATPLAVFEELVQLGEGRILGYRALDRWGAALGASAVDQILQLPKEQVAASLEVEQRFQQWYAWTTDLPGTYFLQVVHWLYKENRLAQGRFVALGRTIDLSQVRVPLFLLAARDDDLVAVQQLLATSRLVGTPRDAIEAVTVSGPHLSLFLGAKTLSATWPRIARWLAADGEGAASAARIDSDQGLASTAI